MPTSRDQACQLSLFGVTVTDHGSVAPDPYIVEAHGAGSSIAAFRPS